MERDWYKIIKNGIENGAINTSYNDSVPFNDILEYYEKQYGIYVNPFQMPDSEKALIAFEYKKAQQESTNNIRENRRAKKLVRLTESQLHRVIKESVKRILSEDEDTDYEIGQEELNHWHASEDRRQRFANQKKAIKRNPNTSPNYNTTFPGKHDDGVLPYHHDKPGFVTPPEASRLGYGKRPRY